MLKKIKNINILIKKAVSNTNLRLEIVFFIGIFFIITASFFINKIFGMYVLGFLLIAYSLYSLKN